MSEELTLEQRIDALERKVGSIDRITATLISNYARESCFDEPKEPLIKDELARKAIRAWAEANSLRCDDKVEARTPTVDCCVLGLTHGFTSIDIIVNEETSLKDYSRYTIAELCGDSKEEE